MIIQQLWKHKHVSAVFPGQEIPEQESFIGQMNMHDLLALQGNLDKYMDQFTLGVDQHWGEKRTYLKKKLLPSSGGSGSFVKR